MPVNTAITFRKGSSSQWSTTNPVLASGEPGYDLSNNILKIGDGVSSWNNLTNHKHSSSDITNFNSSVSGLLPVTNILGGSNIAVSKSGTDFTVAVTGSLGLTTEEVDDRVAALLVAGTGISLNYNDNANTLTIATSGLTVADISGAASLPTTGLTITRSGDWIAWSSPPFFNLVPAQAAQFGGNYVRYNGKWIAGWTSYSETWWLAGPRITSLTFDDLEGVAGSFTPNNMAALTTLSLPALAYVGSGFGPNTMGALTTLSLPALAYAGSFTTNNMAALTTLSLPALAYAGSFNPSTLPALTTVSLPALTRVEGSFTVSAGMGVLNSLSVPSLTAVGGSMTIGTLATATLSFPSLVGVGGNLAISNITNLTTLSFPNLAYAGQSGAIGISISSLPALTALSFPSLVSLIAPQSINSCASLANLTFPTDGRFKTGGSSMTLTGLALTQASVDNVLQAYASLDGTNGTTSFTGALNISGGTSAAPSNLGSTTTAGSQFVCAGTTCTVNWTNHGYTTGTVLRISGITTATNANRYARITVVNANQFTYTITSQNATGAGTATVVRAGASASALVTRGVTLTTN